MFQTRLAAEAGRSLRKGVFKKSAFHQNKQMLAESGGRRAADSLSANTVKKGAYTGVSVKSFILFHKWLHKIKSKAVPRRPIDPGECFATGKGRGRYGFLRS